MTIRDMFCDHISPSFFDWVSIYLTNFADASGTNVGCWAKMNFFSFWRQTVHKHSKAGIEEEIGVNIIIKRKCDCACTRCQKPTTGGKMWHKKKKWNNLPFFSSANFLQNKQVYVFVRIYILLYMSIDSLFVIYSWLFLLAHFSHLCKSLGIKNPPKNGPKLGPLRSYRRPELSSNGSLSAEPDISRLCHLCHSHSYGHIAIYTYIECTRPDIGRGFMVTATTDKRETWLNNFFPRSAVSYLLHWPKKLVATRTCKNVFLYFK